MKGTASPPVKKRPLPLRVWGFFLFLLYFIRAVVRANVELAIVVLSKRRKEIVPGFIDYPVDHLSPLEILVLSHFISLTPGSTTVEVADDLSSLVVHVFDTRGLDDLLESIRVDLEAPILRWTR